MSRKSLPLQVYLMIEHSPDPWLHIEEDTKRFDEDGIIGLYELKETLELARSVNLRLHRKKSRKK